MLLERTFDALRAPTRRRALVALGYVVLVASVIAALAEAWWVGATLFLGGLLVYVLLRGAIRGTDDPSDAGLDERRVAVRNDAYRTAFLALSLATPVAIVALMFVERLGGEVGTPQLEALFYGFVLAAVLTPAAVVAWREPEA